MESSCMFFSVVALLILLLADTEGALAKHDPSGIPMQVSSKLMGPAMAPTIATKNLLANGAPAEAPSISVTPAGPPDPTRGCDESKASMGYCMHSPSHCIDGCIREGFAGGHCHGIVRRCICSCNAT
ncbi:unnamed protein product [Alopecurus aequalis]